MTKERIDWNRLGAGTAAAVIFALAGSQMPWTFGLFSLGMAALSVSWAFARR